MTISEEVYTLDDCEFTHLPVGYYCVGRLTSTRIGKVRFAVLFYYWHYRAFETWTLYLKYDVFFM